MTFTTNASEAMRIDASGNVGIGTSSLTSSSGYQTLSVNGSTGGQIAFQTGGVGKHYIYSTSTDLSVYNSQAGSIKFTTNSSEVMRIDASGNVGIGTSSPSSKLHVNGNLVVTGDIDVGSQVGTWIQSDVMTDAIGWNSSYGVYIGSNIGGTHYLRANGTFSTGGSTYNLWHGGNDGSGSGLDADTVDGIQGSSFLRSDADDTYSGTLTFTSGTLDLSTNDIYLNARVIQNASGGADDGMYIGYANTNSGVTRIYGGGSTSTNLTVNATTASFGGTFDASTSFRAPIFYDVDNTSYYVNPAGASILQGLKLDDSVNNSSGTDAVLWIYRDNNQDWCAIFDYDNGSATDYGLRLDGASSQTYTIQARAAGSQFFRVGTDTVTHNVRMDAPIFYDSNNTSYYVDPASTSNLSTLTSNAAFYYKEWIRNNGTGESGLYWHNTSNPGYKWHIYPQNRQDMTFRTGSGNGGIKGTIDNATARGYIHWTTGNEIGFLNSSRSWSMRVDNSGNTFATTSHRAPIFYDSNNTAYYFDGHATGDSIRVAGDIVAYYSDARLKDFHGRINGALDKVLKINGYYYTENEKAKELGYNTGRTQVGVSAQEVEEVLPEVIKDAPIGHGYKTVQYERMIPLLIEAIKELKEENDTLKARLDTAGL
jgi:hypothetical protein